MSLDERIPYRKSLARLQELTKMGEWAMMGRGEIDEATNKLLVEMTGQHELGGQLKALDAGHQEIYDEYEAMLLRIAPDDLTAFSEYMHGLELGEAPAEHHFYICDRLMELADTPRGRLIISAPPGSAKTTYASRDFPAWYLGRNPRHIVLMAGHTQTFAEDELGTPTRSLVGSDRFRDIFPGIHLDPNRKAAGAWRLNNDRGRYYAKGAGVGIAGFRSNLTGLDDPFASRELAENQGHRNKIGRWFSNDLDLRLLPQAPLYVIATRWHVDDLSGRLIEQSHTDDPNIDKFDYVNLAGLALEDDPIGRELDAPLWPEFWPKSHYLSKKATLLAREWNSLFQGQPTDEEGGVMRGEWIHRYTKLPTAEGRPPPPPDYEETPEQTQARMSQIDPDTILRRLTLSIDSAIKKTERANYTALTVWAQAKSGKHYLVEVVRKRAEFNEMVELIATVAKRHGVSAILIEDKGSGTQYIQTQKLKAPAPIIPISVGNMSKEFRFDAVTPMFSGGEVLFPYSALWLPDCEKELLEFPESKFDDQVDSISQYLAWARPPARGGTKKLKGGV
jgi:predicted phage terminase large subunit-like protein